jgi:hypothetical protein
LLIIPAFQNGKNNAKGANKTMKKKLISVAAFLCLALICFPLAAGAAEYLSENDPIVTLSYLKDIFAPSLKAEIAGEIAQAESDDHATCNAGFAVIELKKGQKLTSASGTVELIVRPGSSAEVISDIPDNGLSDISEAKEVLNGEPCGINHQLIIPRNDGRGVVITSDVAYILVRGDYSVGE